MFVTIYISLMLISEYIKILKIVNDCNFHVMLLAIQPRLALHLLALCFAGTNALCHILQYSDNSNDNLMMVKHTY
jgi:hypothetical protein